MILAVDTCVAIFEENLFRMENEKKNREVAKCLHCGDKIRYGRTDKKFCCEECRNMHYNDKSKGSRLFRRRILSLLSVNYDILTEMWRSGTDSMDLADLQMAGFTPGVFTSFQRRGTHNEYSCFDMRYIMTATRIYSVSKIQNVSLNLHKL